MTQTVEMPALAFRAVVGGVDLERRVVQLTFATSAAVTRRDYRLGTLYQEVLSMDPAHVRLDRLNAGAPLLDSHSAGSVGNVLGAVQPGTARIAHHVGEAEVRFSKRAAVEAVWQDVVDKILRAISVGYNVYRYTEAPGRDGGLPTRTAVDWEPFELSLVPMPADIGARVRGPAAAWPTHECLIVGRSAVRVEDEDRHRRLRLALAQRC